jgi:hypothetical protein
LMILSNRVESANNLPYTFFVDMAPSHTILSNKMDISSWKEAYN